MAGIGGGLHLLRAGGQGGIVLVDGLIGGVGELLRGHLHGGAVHLGAVDADGQVAAGVAGDDLDGVVGVVRELVVRPAPGDGGVQAPGDVAGSVAVGVALDDLQVRAQAREIQRGGGLADAAADLVHRLALDVGGGGLIAPGGGPLAHGAVVGEDLAAVEDVAVDGGGGELHVADPGGGAGDVGLAGTQDIPEEDALQLLRRDGGPLDAGGDRHGLAGLGGVQLRLGLRHVKVRPQLLGGDGLGGGVIAGVLHLPGHGVMDVLGGEHVGGGGGIGDEKAQVPGPVGALQPLAQLAEGDGPAVLGQGHTDAVLAHLILRPLGLPGEGGGGGLGGVQDLLGVHGDGLHPGAKGHGDGL